MALPHLLFAHGWAYDANIWGGIRSRLGDPACTLWERGYYNYPDEPDPPPGPYIAVGHSFGTMRLLGSMPAGAIGFVAICGFARFSAAEDYPGTPARVLDRMLAKAQLSPLSVIAEFRARCGTPGTKVYEFMADRVMDDLNALRDGDERVAAAALDIPVLTLNGGADPIVSAAMSEASFPKAARAIMAGVGHLLPMRAPDWCAQQISAFAARLTR